jgi:hypothetical protein
MKLINFSTLSFLVVTVLAFMIAIPTLSFNFNNKEYSIRGLRLTDINSNWDLLNIGISNSLQQTKAQKITLELELDSFESTDAKFELEYTKSIINNRLLLSNIKDFQVFSLHNTNDNIYKIVIELAEALTDEQIKLLFANGKLEVWTNDTSQNNIPIQPSQTEDATDGVEEIAAEVEDPLKGTIYEKRVVSAINNSDIEFASVVADSRIFMSRELFDIMGIADQVDENFGNQRNFGIKLQFNPNSQIKLAGALSTNPVGMYPLLVTLDNKPVAWQTAGQFFNQTSLPDNIILYPYVSDTRKDVQILATMLATETIKHTINIDNVVNYDLSIQNNNLIKLIIIIVMIFLQAIIYYFYKKKALFTIVTNLIFSVWFIALIKLLGGFAIVFGLEFILATSIVFIIFFMYSLFVLHLQINENFDVFDKQFIDKYQIAKKAFLPILIMLLFISYIMQIFSTIKILHIANVFGIGIIVMIVFIVFAIKPIINLLNIKS